MDHPSEQVDVIVIGAGVVGLAVAARLSHQNEHVMVVEQHAHFGEETSSRNSEVIHAGIYYPQNSLKAQLCVRGKHLLYEYCRQQHIPHKAVGKLIVATHPDELDGLEATRQKATLNGVDDLQSISQQHLKKMLPELNAVEALLSPSTGIIDSHSLMQQLLSELESQNGMLVGQTLCESIQPNKNGFLVRLNSQGEAITLQSKIVINAAGLGAQSLANKIEDLSDQWIPKLHYCRGHYFSYSGRHPFQQLIYPLPEKNGTGLGIHATLDLNHQLRFGPDTEYISQPSYEFEAKQTESLKEKFSQAIRRYWPAMDSERLQPAYAGIRPKLQGPNDPVMDFQIQGEDFHGLPGLVNLFGIESPGLTSCLAIAEYVEAQLRQNES